MPAVRSKRTASKPIAGLMSNKSAPPHSAMPLPPTAGRTSNKGSAGNWSVGRGWRELAMGAGHGLGHNHCSCQGGEELTPLCCDSHMALHPCSTATATVTVKGAEETGLPIRDSPVLTCLSRAGKFQCMKTLIWSKSQALGRKMSISTNIYKSRGVTTKDKAWK